jgi:rhodanese-related sulfurtransferase
MFKRSWLVVFLLLTVVALLLAACGDDKEEEKPTATTVPTTAPATYTTLTVQQAYDLMNGNTNAVFVDVRNPEEWANTGIPVGAALISLPEIEQRAPGELPKDKAIYLICNSGNRSRTAAEILINLGYPKVFNVDGGIQAWLAESLPTEPYTP